jgi:hypothetical protein
MINPQTHFANSILNSDSVSPGRPEVSRRKSCSTMVSGPLSGRSGVGRDTVTSWTPVLRRNYHHIQIMMVVAGHTDLSWLVWQQPNRSWRGICTAYIPKYFEINNQLLYEIDVHLSVYLWSNRPLLEYMRSR